MKSKFKVIIIVLIVLVALVVGMVAAAGLWLKNYMNTEFADVEFIMPEGGVTELIQEYENYPPAAAPGDPETPWPGGCFPPVPQC